MIGLTLVTLVGVLAAGLRSRFEDSVNQLFVANYAVTASDNFTPIGVASENALRGVPGVTVVSGVRAGDGRAFGSRINVTGVAADISKVIDVKWQAGSTQTPAQLGTDGAFVSKDYANAQHLHVGSPLAVETPDRGDAPPRAAGHLLAAEGRHSVRGRDDLAGPVRPVLPEPAEPLHVREHPGWGHARPTRTS